MLRLSWSGSREAYEQYLAAQKPKPKKRSKASRKAKRLRRSKSHLPPSHFVDYRRYIKSKAWRIKREAALKHYGACCAFCHRTDRLEVHHRHYNSLGREKMKDLLVLCESCHKEEHGFNPTVPDALTSEFCSIIR